MRSDLEDALRQAWSVARQQWPAIDVELREYAEYVADRTEASATASGLSQINTDALYLACACARGDDRAVAAFETRHGRDIDVALRRLGLAPDVANDVRQVVLSKLFVSDARKIGDYAGRGELGNWVRVVAGREAISILRKRQPPEDPVSAPIAVESADVELVYLKHAYRTAFREAFEAALSSIDPSDRSVLRYRFAQGLTLDELASVFNVHRATIARRLARLRESLLDATRNELRARLSIDAREFDSLIRLIQSNYELSVSRLLEPR